MGVLKRTPHVTPGPATEDHLDRPALEFDFIDPAHRRGEVQALLFDPDRVEVVQESMTAPDGAFTSAVTTADVVNAVPAEVLRNAVLQK